MGRGRQKAKQTKVARELKYFSPESNFTALQQELRGEAPTSAFNRNHSVKSAADYDDPDYIDDELIAKYANWDPEEDSAA
jgi:hypothetical protein